MDTVKTYSCPNCSAGLRFDPATRTFVCDYCLSSFTEEEMQSNGAEQRAEEEARAGEEFCSQMNEYACPACGAEVVSDENTAATFCPYCQNPVVLRGRLSGQMRPDRIIPFAIHKEEAQRILISYAKRHKFVPRDFFRVEQIEKMQGIYYPFWVTDADTRASLDASATKVRTWRVGNTRYTETSRYRICREGDIHFEDITTCAISEEDKQMLEGILPFPSAALESFDPSFLTGFLAKKRDLESAALAPEVAQRMNGYAGTLLRSTIGPYTSVAVNGSSCVPVRSKWEYALLPMWLLSYQARNGERYLYAINGYTGKFYGSLPISHPKLLAASAGVFAGVAALITLIGGLLF